MNVVTNNHSPMLCRVGILSDSVCNLLPNKRLSKPLASRSRNWMPAQLDHAWLSADISLASRDNIGLMSEPGRVFDITLRFPILLLGLVKAFLAVSSPHQLRLSTFQVRDNDLQIGRDLAGSRLVPVLGRFILRFWFLRIFNLPLLVFGPASELLEHFQVSSAVGGSPEKTISSRIWTIGIYWMR